MLRTPWSPTTTSRQFLTGSDTDLTIFDGALAEIVAGGGPLLLA